MSFASIVIKNTARIKAVEVSSPLRFAYPKSLLSYIYIYVCVQQSSCQRNYPGRICSGEKRSTLHINTPLLVEERESEMK